MAKCSPLAMFACVVSLALFLYGAYTVWGVYTTTAVTDSQFKTSFDDWSLSILDFKNIILTKENCDETFDNLVVTFTCNSLYKDLCTENNIADGPVTLTKECTAGGYGYAYGLSVVTSWDPYTAVDSAIGIAVELGQYDMVSTKEFYPVSDFGVQFYGAALSAVAGLASCTCFLCSICACIVSSMFYLSAVNDPPAAGGMEMPNYSS